MIKERHLRDQIEKRLEITESLIENEALLSNFVSFSREFFSIIIGVSATIWYLFQFIYGTPTRLNIYYDFRWFSN